MGKRERAMERVDDLLAQAKATSIDNGYNVGTVKDDTPKRKENIRKAIYQIILPEDSRIPVMVFPDKELPRLEEMLSKITIAEPFSDDDMPNLYRRGELHLLAGEAESRLSAHDRAKSHYLKALDNFKAIESHDGLELRLWQLSVHILECYQKLAQSSINLGQKDDAINYARDGIKLAKELISNLFRRKTDEPLKVSASNIAISLYYILAMHSDIHQDELRGQYGELVGTALLKLSSEILTFELCIRQNVLNKFNGTSSQDTIANVGKAIETLSGALSAIDVSIDPIKYYELARLITYSDYLKTREKQVTSLDEKKRAYGIFEKIASLGVEGPNIYYWLVHVAQSVVRSSLAIQKRADALKFSRAAIDAEKRFIATASDSGAPTWMRTQVRQYSGLPYIVNAQLGTHGIEDYELAERKILEIEDIDARESNLIILYSAWATILPSRGCRWREVEQGGVIEGMANPLMCVVNKLYNAISELAERDNKQNLDKYCSLMLDGMCVREKDVKNATIRAFASIGYDPETGEFYRPNDYKPNLRLLCEPPIVVSKR